MGAHAGSSGHLPLFPPAPLANMVFYSGPSGLPLQAGQPFPSIHNWVDCLMSNFSLFLPSPSSPRLVKHLAAAPFRVLFIWNRISWAIRLSKQFIDTGDTENVTFNNNGEYTNKNNKLTKKTHQQGMEWVGSMASHCGNAPTGTARHAPTKKTTQQLVKHVRSSKITYSRKEKQFQSL